MKSKLISLCMVICVVMTIHASDYVMLSPLDTALLPAIPIKDHGGDKARSTLEHDAVWVAPYHPIESETVSLEELYKVTKKLYRTTHRHYVTFPVAYWSQTPQGDSLLVSGRVYLPKQRNLNGIVISNHFCTTSDDEVPSNMLSLESIFTMKGYAVLMPDYAGYGLSRDERQPNLYWHNAVQTTVDMLDNMPALLSYYGYSYPLDVVVMGYSQGGAVAFGVARMLEERSNRWAVRSLYMGIDPYNATGTYLYTEESDSIESPLAIPLIVLSLSETYDMEFLLEDFFFEPLLSNYDDWIVSAEHSIVHMNELLASNLLFMRYVYQEL